MSGLNWFPFYHGDYLRDTTSLTAEEHGIYLLLLMRFFAEGPLPDDIDELAMTARTREIERLRKVLTRYWALTDAGWVNSKMQKVRERQELKHQSRVEAGRIGGLTSGAARTRKAKEGRSNASVLLEQTPSNAQASTRTNSVTTVTGDPSPDLKGQVWDLGEKLLGSRAMVGKLIRQHGEAAVFHAVAECVNKSPADPRGYIQGLLRSGAKGEQAKKKTEVFA